MNGQERFCWLVVLCGLAVPAKSQNLTAQDVLELPVTPADHRVFYGDGPLQFADLRLPDGTGPFPVVVFIHGGCWLSEYTLDHASSAAEALRKNGLATWSLEYRRVGDDGGGWPGTFEDVAEGTDYLRKLARDYPLDLSRVVAVGHSAGGHLALWLAARHQLSRDSSLYRPDPLPLTGVVSLAGIPDLKLAHDRQTCGDAVAHLLGGSPEEFPTRYREASPQQLLPLGSLQFLVVAARDAIVPIEFGESYVSSAVAAGDVARLIVLDEAGHFEMIVPDAAEFRRVEQLVWTALNSSGE